MLLENAKLIRALKSWRAPRPFLGIPKTNGRRRRRGIILISESPSSRRQIVFSVNARLRMHRTSVSACLELGQIPEHEPRPHEFELWSHARVLKLLFIEKGFHQSYLIRIVDVASFECRGARVSRSEAPAARQHILVSRLYGHIRTHCTVRRLGSIVSLIDALIECAPFRSDPENWIGANSHVRARDGLFLFGDVLAASILIRGRRSHHLRLLLDSEGIGALVGTKCR